MFNGIVPENYTIPKFHGESGKRTYDDNSFFLLKPDPKGNLTVESEIGSYKIKTKADFLKVFTSKYNWTFSPFNEVDCLFKCFSRDQLLCLGWFNKLEFNNYQVYWVLGTGKVRLTKNNNPHTSKYIINIAPYLQKGSLIENLDDLKEIVSKYICLNEIIPLNPLSPASTEKDLLLSSSNGEFNLFNRLPLDWTKFLHTCYIGPRMETRCLGTIDGVDNIDLVKAYLATLAQCPSLGNVVVKRGTEFFEEAHPGSGYEVKVKVPKEYKTFPPIPTRRDGHIQYPYGEFTTRVSKPYIDTLRKVGNIPFQILDSIQIIPKGKLTYPFVGLVKAMVGFENEAQKYFHPINTKLHYSLVGHMLHIHRVIDPITLKISYETSQDYNPGYACAIQGMVANKLWELAQMSDTEAIRVDALSGYNLPDKEGYRKGNSGLMTFLTPGLKDKPGSTMYRDLIHQDRDFPFVRVNFPLRLGIKAAWYYPHRVGNLVDYATEIPPLGGNRLVERVKRIGVLEEERLPTTIPSIGGESPSIYAGGPQWIDDILHYYPQTRT